MDPPADRPDVSVRFRSAVGVVGVAMAVVGAKTNAVGVASRGIADELGASVGSVFLMVFGVSRSRAWGWWSWPMALLALVVIGLGAWLVKVGSKTQHPLIHRAVLRDHSVTGANLATLGASIAMIGLVYFYGFFAQSALIFGATTVAIAIGTATYLAVSGTKGGPPPAVTGVSNDSAALGGQAYVHAVQTLNSDLRRSFETATHASTVQRFAPTMC